MRNAFLLSAVFCSASAFGVTYTDWTSATATSGSTAGSAEGTIALPNASPIGVTYSGDVQGPTQTGGSPNLGGGLVQNYWNPFTPFLNSVVTAPPQNTDIIALGGGPNFVNTITFSRPVTDPLLLIVSLGTGDVQGQYDFDQEFTILSSGLGFFGEVDGPTLSLVSPSVLGGVEGHGTIQFTGTFTSISFSSTEEFWSGFTVALPSNVPDSLGFFPALGALATCLAAGRGLKR